MHLHLSLKSYLHVDITYFDFVFIIFIINCISHVCILEDAFNKYTLFLMDIHPGTQFTLQITHSTYSFAFDSPLSVLRSTSTVGFPRESRISLAMMLKIDILKDREETKEHESLTSAITGHDVQKLMASNELTLHEKDTYLTVIGSKHCFGQPASAINLLLHIINLAHMQNT